MRFDVLTLFPDLFPGYLGQSLLKKAIDRGMVQVELHDLRRWSKDKHHKVDDRPFGGGPGMVLRVEPVVECVEDVQRRANGPGRVVMLTPQGRKLNQQIVEELAQEDRLLLLCGRYEGFDQRVVDLLQPDEISVGDYILNGGEVAAMVIIDAVLRLVPGVLGEEQSTVEDSFSTGNRHLEWAQYTRPREYRGHKVPEVLLSGDHKAIAQWRREQGFLKTKTRRADLLETPPTELPPPAGSSEPPSENNEPTKSAPIQDKTKTDN
ncbi:MAG: tRNA (guanosine(37)-N1)-methyltransferase TrmD [Pirellulaceae bacterium]|jgi:tRNA (guanine37-N1)-methyltransferase|nr:tRNA (guanosine(37)-N1)-methyltransferase TrmD [Pirellulaceae bacterium]HJN09639.1 tRNA (guanosine(37)-N1)-methyltransferase TrmD [Pirellulaceae bacterium]